MDARKVQGILATASEMKKFNIGEYVFEIKYAEGESNKIEKVTITKPKSEGIGLDVARKILVKCSKVEFGPNHYDFPEDAATNTAMRMFSKLLLDIEKQIAEYPVEPDLVKKLIEDTNNYFHDKLIKCLEKARRTDCVQISEIHVYDQEELEKIVEIIKNDQSV